MSSYLIDDLVQTGALTPILEAYEPDPLPVSVIYPSQRQAPLKLRAFLDFAIPKLRERLDYKNAPDAGGTAAEALIKSCDAPYPASVRTALRLPR